MYTQKNFQSKKDLKAAVAAAVAGTGPQVKFFQPGPFGNPEADNKKTNFALEGPHFPEQHKWYASATADGAGNIVKVK